MEPVVVFVVGAVVGAAVVWAKARKSQIRAEEALAEAQKLRLEAEGIFLESEKALQQAESTLAATTDDLGFVVSAFRSLGDQLFEEELARYSAHFGDDTPRGLWRDAMERSAMRLQSALAQAAAVAAERDTLRKELGAANAEVAKLSRQLLQAQQQQAQAQQQAQQQVPKNGVGVPQAPLTVLKGRRLVSLDGRTEYPVFSDGKAVFASIGGKIAALYWDNARPVESFVEGLYCFAQAEGVQPVQGILVTLNGKAPAAPAKPSAPAEEPPED